MGFAVTFSYTDWALRYPEFSASGTYLGVTSAQAQLFFNEATLYHRNDGGGPIPDPVTQELLLNMLTAHIAMLAVGTAAAPASGQVGRIASAGQGSVNVSFELPEIPGTQAWFAQSQYGLSYLQATAMYRTMQYMPGPHRYFGLTRRWGF